MPIQGSDRFAPRHGYLSMTLAETTMGDIVKDGGSNILAELYCPLFRGRVVSFGVTLCLWQSALDI